MTTVVRRTKFSVSADELFAFHMDTNNLARISPPWPPFTLLSKPGPAAPGDLQVFRLGVGPLGTTWHARVTRVVPGRLLEDVQERGPFRSWRHQHRFLREETGSVLADVVSFRMLPTPVGEFLEYFFVRPAIVAMFAWRHRRTKALLEGQRYANGSSTNSL